jgi:signal transduction histidine kinase
MSAPSPLPSPEHCASDDASLAAAGLGTWQIDIGASVVVCNDRCATHLASSNAATITPDLILGEDSAGLVARVGASNEKKPFELERLVASSAGSRWVLVQGIRHYGEDGRLYTVTGFTLDITDRKQRELDLQARANSERAARERSEALAAIMDQFVMSVSHELRSPLNAIVTWAEVLRFATAPADIERVADAITRNGRQLSLMVDDLLDSGAITTGKLSVHRQPIDLRALVLAVAEDMHKQAEHKHIALRIGEMTACRIVGDESRMKQVVWNLLSNALKFTEAGSVEIDLRVVDADAQITVRDTGRGISAEALPLVFDRFRQVSPNASGRIGGLGLGLWLVKHIVGLHGGTVTANSEGPGQGATFTVRVPCAASGPIFHRAVGGR